METESYEEAEDYIRQSIRIRYVLLHPNFISLLFSCDREKHFGEDSFQCMQAYDILAGILCKKGRLDEAEEKAHTSIDTKIKILGHNHPEVGRSLVGMSLQDLSATKRRGLCF